MTWIGQTFTVGQILTAAQMNNLQADITAAMNQDSGAPAPGTDFITLQAQLGNSVIGQAELKTTTASQSVSIASGIHGQIAPTGGTYSFNVFLGGDTVRDDLDSHGSVHAGTYAATMEAFNSGGVSRTLYGYSRYVQASRPYVTADGEIRLFIYLLINNLTKKILGVSVAQDPPWAYNGSYHINPHKVWRHAKTKKLYHKERQGIITLADVRSGTASMQEMVDDFKTSKEKDVELNMTRKFANMANVPHPFMNEDLTGKTILLLDPVSPLMDEFDQIQIATEGRGNDSMVDLLQSGHIIFGNVELGRTRPPSVMTVAPGWKNTRG